jgi:hypothetical protein
MRKDRIWGNEHTMECMAKALKVKINSIQEHSLKKNTYFVHHAHNPEEELELNILYDYEAHHYEALVPSSWILTGNNNFQSESDSFASEGEACPLIKTEKMSEDKVSVPEKVKTLKRKRNVHIQQNKRKKCEVSPDLSSEATVGDFLTWYVKVRTEQTEKLEKLKKSQSKANVFDEDSNTDSERSENIKESGEFVLEETLMNQEVNLAHSDSEKNEEKERIESDVSDFEKSITNNKHGKNLSDSEISENDSDNQGNHENEKNKDEIQTASAGEDSENNLIKVTAKPFHKECQQNHVEEITRKKRQPHITDIFKKQSNKKQSNKNSEEEGNVSDNTNDQKRSDVTNVNQTEFKIPPRNKNFQKESDQHSKEDELNSDSAESP